MLYAFAFKKYNVSCRTLYQLSAIDHRTLLWGEKSINVYMEKLIHDQPLYVLGMGIYTRRDKELLKIETICSNQFGKKFIEGESLERVKIQPFLKPGIHSCYGESIGTSYCNLVSWKITRLISSGRLNSRYTFIHIPKTMKMETASQEIQQMLSNIS